MKKSSKYSVLYNWGVILLTIGFFIGMLFVIRIASHSTSSSSSSSSADGFTIESYNVVLNVDENNSVDVKEYITVYFYEGGHHGIYRFIPEWLEYTNKDGETLSRKSTICNLVCYSDTYSVSTENGKKQIKMGDANTTLSAGTFHTYEIGYTYDMGADTYEDFDEFIFHAFGDYWGTTINNATIEIILPESIDLSDDDIHFFDDKYRENDITSYVDYTVYENTIYAELSSYYNLTSALTIDIELPDGYFVNETSVYGNYSLIFCIICVVFAIITFLIWRKNGKDLDKVPETVEFYPPEGLDASQIGYLYKADTGRKLSIALIVELASKGYIKIIESEDKEKITIVKSNYVDINQIIKREVKITKLQDYTRYYPLKYLKNKDLMKKYFNDGDEYVITENFDEFYEEADYLIKNNYIKVEYDTIDNYSEEELEKIKKSSTVDDSKDKPKMTENEELIYNQLFQDDDKTVLSENHSFYLIFGIVAKNVRDEFEDKINDLKACKCMLFTSLGFMICTILLGVAYCFIEDLNPKFNFMYVLALIADIVIFIFSICMKRKNSYGEQMEARIKGFKNYIELAEKNQIEMLVEENPNYFYDILPYAYVLDVSKKWIDKFENIPIPVNDMGNFDFCDIGALDSLSSSVYYPSSSSSGGGGGCSSCGGGCSSCGGGGSW